MSENDAMNGFSLWSWIIVIGFSALVLVPVVKIVRKAGFSGWWAILAVLPILNLVGLWLLALIPWRTDARSGDAR